MKRPNLFILGAPKCGTTALAKWLSTHPDVFMSPVKEPHYFSDEHRLTPTREAYDALFADTGESHRWICEASVWHLFSHTAVPSILRYSPDARFVVMVRNPLEMAPSMHEQHRFNGNELVADFSEALALNDVRRNGSPVGVRAGYSQPEQLAYLHSCALGWQLDRLFGRVARERVHVIVHDDLASNASAAYMDLLRFLGLPPLAPPVFDKINSAKRRKSFFLDGLVLRLASAKKAMGISRRLGLLARARRWNAKQHRREPVPDSTRNEMAEAFAQDTARLGRLLGRDFGHWLENEQVGE